MKTPILLLAVMMMVFSAIPAASAATAKKETAEEKKAKEEEETRLDAQKLISDAGRKPVSGKVAMITDDPTLAAKPFPKVVAQLAKSDGTVLPVMVPGKDILDQLVRSDKRQITVMGTILDKKDKGLFLIIDEIAAAPALPAVAPLRKRGAPL